MSEHITHTAICDDVRRLALQLDDLPSVFHQAWTRFGDIGRLGGVTRHADLWSADLVQRLRPLLEQSPPDEPAMRKLAFVLGALTHRSIDRQMKPVFAYFKQSVDARIIGGQRINECTIYCDMLILQKVFGMEQLFAPTLFDGTLAGRRAALHEALRTTWQRVLIQMHTFKPDDGNIDRWLEQLFAGVQDFGLRLDLYDQIAAEPDPDKVRRYLDDTRFYVDDDPIIAAARRLQSGQAVTPAALNAAIDTTGPSHSLYAQAMARAVSYIRAAAALFRQEIDPEQAKRRMDIGVAELALGFTPPPATAP